MYTVDGTEYSTVEALSSAFELPVSTILNRLDNGKTIEEAVKAPRKGFIPVEVQGQSFPSIAMAARFFKVCPSKARDRLRQNWTLEEALGICPHKKKITNHNNTGKKVVVNGVTYKSIKDAATAYNFKPRFISNRVKSGLSIEQALELEPFPDDFIPGSGQSQRKTKKDREAKEKQSGKRVCSRCKCFKDICEFHGSYENNNIASHCRECISANFLRYRYNISLADFMDMRKEQQDKCKICLATLEINDGSSLRSKNVAVDHCHTTGTVRGLLCAKCNKGLGCFQDNVDTLRAAIEYLENNHSKLPQNAAKLQ